MLRARSQPLARLVPPPPRGGPPLPTSIPPTLSRSRGRGVHAGIFGLIIAVIIATNITVPKDGKSTYSLFSGYAHLGSGLTVGLSNLATGLAMGMAGEIGVQDSARQPKLYIGMVLIWSFGSALGAPLPGSAPQPIASSDAPHLSRLSRACRH